MADPFRVLVVDDDPLVHMITSEILVPAGFQLVHAEDGEQALTLMQAAPAQVVVLDMLMPNKEGLETIVELRGHWPLTKVVAISGGGRIAAAELLDWARVAGADATLTKPLDRDRLLSAIQSVLKPRTRAVA